MPRLLNTKRILNSTFLQPAEIVDLTKRTVRPAQVRVLKAMGIEHRVRPDGSVAILRAHITKVFDGDTQSTRQPQAVQPNWDAM
jgi:hypothetical protein